MKKIVVTGGSGSAGRAVVKELVSHDYDVLNIDVIAPKEHLSPYLKVDLMDLGQVFEALHQADGVVHLGAIPGPHMLTEELTFRTNMTSTFNVFHAATLLRVKRVVWASSARVIGVPFEHGVPQYVPIDERHACIADSSYALSKVLGEEMARQFHRISGIPFVGLRFSYILAPERREAFLASYQESERFRRELWGYVDARDAAQCCRLGLEADIKGAEVFMITAADSGVSDPMHELLANYFPAVPIREPLDDNASLFSIKKARELLGYQPRYSWRDRG